MRSTKNKQAMYFLWGVVAFVVTNVKHAIQTMTILCLNLVVIMYTVVLYFPLSAVLSNICDVKLL